MALSKQQFIELRNEGLSIDQIIRFEKGETPEQPSTGLKKIAEQTTGRAVELTKGALKSGLSTARGAGRLLGSVTGGQLVPEEKPEIFKTQNRLQEIGFLGAQIAEFFIPGGAATKLSKVGKLGQLAGKTGKLAQTGVRAGVEAGLVGGQTALQTGEVGKEAKTGAVIGASIPVIGKAVGLTSRLFKSFSKNLAGAITGKGTEVIEKVIAKPEQAKIGLKGDEVKVLKDVATKILEGVKKIKQEASKAYEKALENLPDVQFAIDDIAPVIKESLENFGIKVTDKLGFKQSPFIGAEESVLKKVFETIKGWDDLSAKGLNRLAQQVGRFRKTGTQSRELNNVVDSIKRNIRNIIGKKVPEIDKMNKVFGEEQKFLEDLGDVLSVKAGGITPLNIRKVADKINTLFNSNKGMARGLVEQLEKREGIDILATEAGRQLGQAPSRAAVSIGNTIRTVLQTIITPKSVGELASATGIASNKLIPVLQRMRGLGVNERNSIITILELLFR